MELHAALKKITLEDYVALAEWGPCGDDKLMVLGACITDFLFS